MTPFFLIAASQNPHETLALEEAILQHVQPGQIVLYLYTHRPSVIIGRTQNAWAECRHERLAEDGGVLARRISGGGAVYHDPENLNFSFICSREVYDQHKQLQVVLDAVRSFGIDAVFSGRNDLLAGGSKFSGNAFCVRPRSAMHHGTILIDTDTERMSRYLNVAPGKLESKGVKSVRSRVVNLRRLVPTLTREIMQEMLRTKFEAVYGPACSYILTPEIEADARTLKERNASWEWLFGKTPAFSVCLYNRFPWGSIELGWELRNGKVQTVRIFSDSMTPDLILRVEQALRESNFARQDLQNALEDLNANEDERIVLRDLQQLMAQELD